MLAADEVGAVGAAEGRHDLQAPGQRVAGRAHLERHGRRVAGAQRVERRSPRAEREPHGTEHLDRLGRRAQARGAPPRLGHASGVDGVRRRGGPLRVALEGRRRLAAIALLLEQHAEREGDPEGRGVALFGHDQVDDRLVVHVRIEAQRAGVGGQGVLEAPRDHLDQPEVVAGDELAGVELDGAPRGRLRPLEVAQEVARPTEVGPVQVVARVQIDRDRQHLGRGERVVAIEGEERTALERVRQERRHPPERLEQSVFEVGRARAIARRARRPRARPVRRPPPARAPGPRGHRPRRRRWRDRPRARPGRTGTRRRRRRRRAPPRRPGRSARSHRATRSRPAARPRPPTARRRRPWPRPRPGTARRPRRGPAARPPRRRAPRRGPPAGLRRRPPDRRGRRAPRAPRPRSRRPAAPGRARPRRPGPTGRAAAPAGRRRRSSARRPPRPPRPAARARRRARSRPRRAGRPSMAPHSCSRRPSSSIDTSPETASRPKRVAEQGDAAAVRDAGRQQGDRVEEAAGHHDRRHERRHQLGAEDVDADERVGECAPRRRPRARGPGFGRGGRRGRRPKPKRSGWRRRGRGCAA